MLGLPAGKTGWETQTARKAASTLLHCANLQPQLLLPSSPGWLCCGTCLAALPCCPALSVACCSLQVVGNGVVKQNGGISGATQKFATGVQLTITDPDISPQASHRTQHAQRATWIACLEQSVVAERVGTRVLDLPPTSWLNKVLLPLDCGCLSWAPLLAHGQAG